MSNKLSTVERAILNKDPMMAEVEVVVKSFKSGKSPGLDGLTVEVLHSCWEWAGEVYFNAVLAFWRDGILIA